MPRKKPGPYDTLWRLALALPGVEEGRRTGRGLQGGGKLDGAAQGDGESFVILIDFEERERLMKADPATFYVTDHYLNYPSISCGFRRSRPRRFATCSRRPGGAPRPRAGGGVRRKA